MSTRPVSAGRPATLPEDASLIDRYRLLSEGHTAVLARLRAPNIPHPGLDHSAPPEEAIRVQP
ncbi:hypothetical protein OF83DRAFT_1174826 [Amylostereum chailletii]|nr:hypothetical protein OF83DRAFT_1174826 [Amylostereum chailletii]